MPKTNELTQKETLFIEYYLQNGNATQAAIKAGYSGNTAAVIACENLKKQVIIEEIAKRLQEVIEGINADKVIKETGVIAFSNIKDFISWDEAGRVVFKTSKELTPEQTACIKKIKHKTSIDGEATTYALEFELFDKMKGLDSLGNFLGMKKQKIEHSGGGQTHGVLVVPGMANSVEEWLEEGKKQKEELVI